MARGHTYYWEEAYNIKIAPDFGFVAAGSSSVYGQSDWDMYVVKTDAAGNSGCDSSTAITVTNISIPVKSLSVYDSLITMNFYQRGFYGDGRLLESNQCAGINSVNSISSSAITVFPNPATRENKFCGK